MLRGSDWKLRAMAAALWRQRFRSTLAAVMGPDLQLRDPIVLLSEQGAYSNTAYTDFNKDNRVFPL